MLKISKEVWLVIALVGFLLAYLIDRLAGPVYMVIGSPIAFLTSVKLLNTYPFTAIAIVIRSLSIFISVMLLTGLFNRNYFTKAIVLLFVGILAEFYSIQQLANGFRMTTIQWTLAIAYGSALLVFGIIALILRGIWAIFNPEVKKVEVTEENKESILTPSDN